MTENKKIKDKDSNTKDIVSGGILFLLVLAVWYLSWYYIDNSILSEECGLSDTEARGQFGDKFGAVNALFSALAFAGIIFTIFLQKRELKLQREEMEETRGEFIKQNATLIQQKFENTFFQLLTLFNSIVDSLDLRKRNSNSEIISTGRDCFNIFYTRFYNFAKDETYPRTTENLENISVEKSIKAYENLYDQEKADMSHYYRTIYHIFKFIDNSNLEDKNQYASIARAQLSSYEQILIFYNCLHPNGIEKFKPLIEKYAIFKNIDSSLLLNQEHLEKYEKEAYGK